VDNTARAKLTNDREVNFKKEYKLGFLGLGDNFLLLYFTLYGLGALLTCQAQWP
jgi:hypothetical protein